VIRLIQLGSGMRAAIEQTLPPQGGSRVQKPVHSPGRLYLDHQMKYTWSTKTSLCDRAHSAVIINATVGSDGVYRSRAGFEHSDVSTFSRSCK
jgi:hypothetical protein